MNIFGLLLYLVISSIIIIFIYHLYGKHIAKVTTACLGAFFLFCFLFLIISTSFVSNRKLNKAMERMNDEINYLEKKVENGEAYTDKYKADVFKLDDGSTLIRVYNDRDEYVNADCFVSFYDNGKKVDVPNNTYITDIAPHSYGYSKVLNYIYLDSNKKYDPDDVKVYLTPSNYRIHCENDLAYNYNSEEDILYGINKYDGVIVDIKFGFIYYDEQGKIRDYRSHYVYNDIAPAGEFSDKLYINEKSEYDIVLEKAICKKVSN